MIVCQSAPPASSPPPRLRARSMLSCGTECLLAFWMASNSVGLPSGSPPPVRAATSMFLISFAKSLPRLASSAAFLCFVVAHFEWPLTTAPRRLRAAARGRPVLAGSLRKLRSRLSLHDFHEQSVYPRVPRQLGVERRGQHGALTNRDDPTGGGFTTRDLRVIADSGEHLDLGGGGLDPRRPDENGVDFVLYSHEVQVLLEGVDLPTEGVAPHDHVETAELVLVRAPVEHLVGQENHAGTRPVRGHPVLDALPHGFEQLEDVEQPRHRGRLATRQHQAVHFGQLRRAADRHRARTAV